MKIIDTVRKSLDERAERTAQRLLTQTKGNRWRTARGVRSLAFLAVGLIIAIFLSGFFLPFGTSLTNQNILSSLIFLCLVIIFKRLHYATRGLFILRHHFLDERQIALRLRIYSQAYRWLSLIIVILIFVIYEVIDNKTNYSRSALTYTLDKGTFSPMSFYLGALSAITMLPYLLFAFMAPGEEAISQADED
jgi:hypothetical protein